MTETLDDPVKLYMTHPLSSDKIQRLTSLPADIQYFRLDVQPYTEEYLNLTPLQLFQRLEKSEEGHQYFIVADKRSHNELSQPDSQPTVIVAGVWSTTPRYEWDVYRGTIDLNALPEDERLAILRQMAEQRAIAEANESGSEEWAWESDASQNGIDAKLWQIKSIRSDIKGMVQICEVYDVKDIRDAHLYFIREAEQSGGVYIV